jgi:hypothetical protein
MMKAMAGSIGQGWQLPSPMPAECFVNLSSSRWVVSQPGRRSWVLKTSRLEVNAGPAFSPINREQQVFAVGALVGDADALQ